MGSAADLREDQAWRAVVPDSAPAVAEVVLAEVEEAAVDVAAGAADAAIRIRTGAVPITASFQALETGEEMPSPPIPDRCSSRWRIRR